MMQNRFTLALAGLAALTACASVAVQAEDVTEAPPAFDSAFPPAIEEINFQSHGDRLNGLVYLANGPGPHPAVVLLHGFPGNERNLDLAQDLRTAGFNVMFFHYRGAWGSEGEYTLTHVIEDVAAATDYLRTHAEKFRTDPEKISLVGHSMGGFAALEGAARDPKVSCVAGIAPANVGAMAAYMEAAPEAKAEFMAYSDSLQMLKGLTGEKLLAEMSENQAAFDLAGLAPKLEGKSVLVVGADTDASVPADTIVRPLIEVYESNPEIDTTGVILSGDHSFSWSRDELISTVIDWAEGCR